MSSFNGLYNEFIARSIEGRVSTEQNVKNDAAAPKIALLIIAFLQHFRRNVVGCSELLREFLAWLYERGGSKVNDFNFELG